MVSGRYKKMNIERGMGGDGQKKRWDKGRGGGERERA